MTETANGKIVDDSMRENYPATVKFPIAKMIVEVEESDDPLVIPSEQVADINLREAMDDVTACPVLIENSISLKEDSLAQGEIVFDSEGEEFRVVLRSLTVSDDINQEFEPKKGFLRRCEIWRNRQHRKMIAGLRRLIEYKFVGPAISIDELLHLQDVQDFTDRVEDIREAVSRSTNLELNEFDEIVAKKEKSIISQPSDLLALPYKRFIYKFDGSDYFVNQKPVYLTQSASSRDPSIAVNGDTGNTVWDAAVFLTSYLDSNHDLVCNKNVLELGSGLGLCGIAASHIGAQSVTFTDLGYILQSTRENLTSNNIDPNLNPVVELDWSHPDRSTIDWSSVQVVIASDIVWLAQLVDPLCVTLTFIHEHCHNLEQIIFSNQRRSDVVTDAFLNTAEKLFRIENTQTDDSLEIHTLRRKV